MMRTGIESLPPDVPLSDQWKQSLAIHFSTWQVLSSQYHLEKCAFAVAYAIGPFDERRILSFEITGEMTARTALNRLDLLDVSFREDTGSKLMFWMDADRGKYFRTGFSDAVNDAFPSASVEIKEANACYALGRDTACVFHLMRAVEYALRATAIAVGMTTSLIPLEYQQWNTIVEGIDSIVGRLPNSWSDPAKSNARAFFRRTVSDLYAFKDETRNVLMHTRKGAVHRSECTVFAR